MKDWYLRQSPRDRLIVMIVAVLTIISLLYAVAWYPLQARKTSLEQALVSKQETLEFIRRAGVQLRASAGNDNTAKTSDKAPYLLIDEVIRQAKMDPPERVEPSGANGARVQFGEVEFDKLVAVLAELELYGLEISTLTISRKNPGTVSARFNMERS
ncbi:type II secretion system protein GspM [Granulosicoccus antarcticus]|uniref:Type II secretion system protein M n=1 Tax=Granulosicoccus antarcticus IMCC3135 TaxID=1192854 RepID=A0A2Z2P7H8_9GAMM|nr:type II secretion system protein GspM [Granulosicoccus antarcticus]ASJ76647.1 Type II secretion system protein M [Granulosicoccus antarcticus IMCC3135]